jgi:endonuclease-3
MDKQQAVKIINMLRKRYGAAVCALNYKTPFQLLAAVILSAQCTDVRVNIVTAELFKKYSSPADFAAMSKDELIGYIKSCGFYNEKSESIISAAQDVIGKFGGKVPDNMEDLLKLRGVGRKTANVILAEAFNIPAIPVDTHVLRLANRIGLSDGMTPEEVEQDLAKIIPQELWIESHHLLIGHGRVICKAVKPDCDNCPIINECEYF